MKTAIVKISGKSISELVNTDKWINNLKKFSNEYDGLVLVHGAGKNISEWSEKLGLETKFIDGQRVTSKEQMEIVAAIQAGILNSQINAKLNSNGFESIGLSGIDRNTFTAEYFNKELGFVGKPNLTGSISWIKDLLNSNVIPVFSSVCKDASGNLMNVNADIFAETLAVALNADSVFFVSDVEGVKINGNVKETLTEEEIINGIVNGDITEGMIPKLNSCIELLKKGIDKVWIGSQITDTSINKKESGNGNGTWIVSTDETEYKFLKIA
jgi:acetylglutamate kinase